VILTPILYIKVLIFTNMSQNLTQAVFPVLIGGIAQSACLNSFVYLDNTVLVCNSATIVTFIFLAKPSHYILTCYNSL
jgi:hypothetical protein